MVAHIKTASFWGVDEVVANVATAIRWRNIAF